MADVDAILLETVKAGWHFWDVLIIHVNDWRWQRQEFHKALHEPSDMPKRANYGRFSAAFLTKTCKQFKCGLWLILLWLLLKVIFLKAQSFDSNGSWLKMRRCDWSLRHGRWWEFNFSSLEFLVVLVRKTSWRRRWRSSVANQSLRWRRVSPSSVSHCHLLMLPAWQAPPHLHQLLEASVSFAGLKQRNLGVAKEASVQMPKQMSQIVITIWSNGIWHEMVWVWEPLTASKSKGHACHLSPIPMAQQQHALVPWAKAQPAGPMPQPPTVQSRELWHRVLLSVKHCLQSPIEAELREWSLCCALTAFWCLVDTIEL